MTESPKSPPSATQIIARLSPVAFDHISWMGQHSFAMPDSAMKIRAVLDL